LRPSYDLAYEKTPETPPAEFCVDGDIVNIYFVRQEPKKDITDDSSVYFRQHRPSTLDLELL